MGSLNLLVLSRYASFNVYELIYAVTYTWFIHNSVSQFDLGYSSQHQTSFFRKIFEDSIFPLWLIVLLQVGKWADLVLWKPSFFGAKPEMVIKGGVIAWANMGDPNASIPTPEPVCADTIPIFI